MAYRDAVRWQVVAMAGVVALFSAACAGDGSTTAPSPVTPTSTPTLEVAGGTGPPTPVPPTPVLATPVSALPVPARSGAVQPEGFTSVEATVTLADGTVCELCLWLAETAEERSRGLMAVTDLDGADGMVFVYDATTQGRFWMRDTPMPLSIAFFAADGAFVSTSEMTPCLDGPADACPRYGADGPYAAAVELPAGEVAALGIAAGSRLELGTDVGCADA